MKSDSEAFDVGCLGAVFCAGNLFSVHAASLEHETYDESRYVYLKRNKLYFLWYDSYAPISLHYVTLHYSNKFCEDRHILVEPCSVFCVAREA